MLERAAVRVGGRVGVRHRAQVVEEVVRGHAEGVDHVEHAIHRAAGVVAALAGDAELAGVVVGVLGAPHAALHRRGGGDRLEGRAGRARALDRAVDQWEVARAVVELLVDRFRDRPGEDVRVEGGQRPHRVDLAVVGIHGHEGAAVGRVVGVDRLLERLLAHALEVQVERELERVAGRRRSLRQVAREVPQGVDLDAVGAVLAAQVLVVVVLEAGLADDRAAGSAPEVGLRELAVGLGQAADRSDRSEQLRRQPLVGVLAQPHLLDLHAREGVLALLEVVLDVLGDVLLDRDGRVGQRRVSLRHRAGDGRDVGDTGAVDRALDPRRRDPEDPGQPVVDGGVLGRRVVEQRRGHRHRQVGRRDHDGRDRCRAHEHGAVAIEDLSPR